MARPDIRYDNRLKVRGNSLDFGIRKSNFEYVSYHNLASSTGTGPPCFVLHLDRNDLEISFTLSQPKTPQQSFSCKIPLSQITNAFRWPGTAQDTNLILQLQHPPMLFCKASDYQRGQREQSMQQSRRRAMLGPSSIGRRLELGSWLAYRLVVLGQARALDNFCNQLRKERISIQDHAVDVTRCVPVGLWDWLGTSEQSTLSGMETSLRDFHLDAITPYLPFELLYQLEVCMSNGWLQQAMLSQEFVERLLAIVPAPPQKPTKACKLLVHLANMKRYMENPMDVFTQTLDSSSVDRLPAYCTRIRTATITPMTIYFHSPSVDTSNRILRRYRHLEDRFLRVKFRDELYRGRLQSQDNGSFGELFDRVKYIMKTGITVGQRNFEFLAFGNSQFREHGAYFFAPTHDLSTETIRQDMGCFDNIKVVAKYAARLGQSFSTTRATTNGVQILDVPDIYHGRWCFTDGVGKISLFMAQMIAQDMRLPSSAEHCPSAYQFRLAGCKGVLAIDKSVKGTAIHIRPSQTKFMAKHSGLEIVRASQFSASFLNQQIILILSAHGIQDNIFIERLRTMLSNLSQALSDQAVALRMLQCSTDINQTTVTLASMINAGLMQTSEPFLMSCMQLWRAWSIKYLKEKAKILVEQGAFLIGCVDETAVLQGHKDLSEEQTVDNLPEIFVQISQYDLANPGKRTGYKIVEGLCMLTRNPALHPGDIRVVKAVNRPELHHLRDVVVFSQTGDRDLPSMCAGGDLDGDDFLVIWDPEMIPKQWNTPAALYTPPSPVTSEKPVTIDAIIDFYVQHMQNDNLGLIATAHRYWADQLELGVKHPKCIQLADLHSQAVDYAKTGVPAPLPKHLKTVAWPHWAESKAHPSKVYRSTNVLGKLYDLIDRESFVPDASQPFNEQILATYELDPSMLEQATSLKVEYDTAVRELMHQHGIKTEFEVWTGFVMQHSENSNDYTLPETLGRSMATIKEHIRSLAYERAGTSERERDTAKLGPFVAAMYATTARERDQAVLDGGQAFISFPWTFANELCLIARGRFSTSSTIVQSPSRQTQTILPLQESIRRLGKISSAAPSTSATMLPELTPLKEIEPDQNWSIDALVKSSAVDNQQPRSLFDAQSQSEGFAKDFGVMHTRSPEQVS